MKDAPAERSAPLHIVNIALNVVATKKLAWQQRKAESFTVSALHSGSFAWAISRQRNMLERMEFRWALRWLSAAQQPAQTWGITHRLFFTMVMTFFNARLGWWLPNPGPKEAIFGG